MVPDAKQFNVIARVRVPELDVAVLDRQFFGQPEHKGDVAAALAAALNDGLLQAGANHLHECGSVRPIHVHIDRDRATTSATKAQANVVRVRGVGPATYFVGGGDVIDPLRKAAHCATAHHTGCFCPGIKTGQAGLLGLTVVVDVCGGCGDAVVCYRWQQMVLRQISPRLPLLLRSAES